MPVYVIGASGDLGGLVVRALLDRGAEVTALVPETEGPLPSGSVLTEPGVRVVHGDLRDPGPLPAGARGCEAMFVLTPHAPDQVELQNNAADVAADVGARVVKVSSWGPAVREDSPDARARRHWITQQYLAKRGLPSTVLFPNYFMQVLLHRCAASVRERGMLVSPAGDRGISMVDLRDVAEVAARVLTEPGHEGESYTLSGPTAPTYREIAQLLTELTSRPVRCDDMSGEEFARHMAGANRPRWETDHAAAVFGLYRQGVGEPVTDDVRRITGHEPRAIGDFLKDHLRHFLPTGVEPVV
ncbi:NmrA family NAD(P)-binding protein [Streptacidiphilus rugosus]|uniref:NmrA family NAD(P)-binding protein n=1 Tax=Streptacidiphilus rugosus TaxID=405783 RepID=UPI00068E0400|nr:NmrA family NAD(P)-binding protein [Streptacidiphilus rugosus]